MLNDLNNIKDKKFKKQLFEHEQELIISASQYLIESSPSSYNCNSYTKQRNHTILAEDNTIMQQMKLQDTTPINNKFNHINAYTNVEYVYLEDITAAIQASSGSQPNKFQKPIHVDVNFNPFLQGNSQNKVVKQPTGLLKINSPIKQKQQKIPSAMRQLVFADTKYSNDDSCMTSTSSSLSETSEILKPHVSSSETNTSDSSAATMIIRKSPTFDSCTTTITKIANISTDNETASLISPPQYTNAKTNLNYLFTQFDLELHQPSLHIATEPRRKRDDRFLTRRSIPVDFKTCEYENQPVQQRTTTTTTTKQQMSPFESQKYYRKQLNNKRKINSLSPIMTSSRADLNALFKECEKKLFANDDVHEFKVPTKPACVKEQIKFNTMPSKLIKCEPSKVVRSPLVLANAQVAHSNCIKMQAQQTPVKQLKSILAVPSSHHATPSTTTTTNANKKVSFMLRNSLIENDQDEFDGYENENENSFEFVNAFSNETYGIPLPDEFLLLNEFNSFIEANKSRFERLKIKRRSNCCNTVEVNNKQFTQKNTKVCCSSASSTGSTTSSSGSSSSSCTIESRKREYNIQNSNQPRSQHSIWLV